MHQQGRVAEARERDTARLEAFSDGVFAIAVTLLVLNIHVPASGDKGGLGQALGEQWPTYLAFLLSFLTILNLWVNHHKMFNLIARSDHWLLFLNGLLLLGVIVLPFPTALVAQYVAAVNGDTFAATAVYAGVFTYLALCYFALWIYASTKMRLLDADLDPRKIQQMRRRYLSFVPFYVVALVLLFVQPVGTLVVYFLLMLIYTLPGYSLSGTANLYPEKSAV